ncbi:MAG: hypothetical protein NW217_14970 [Hyphomicrobiaceae bacterium]|nr:hypothetical protein [Hyphomicrobiaceae bacterium]
MHANDRIGLGLCATAAAAVVAMGLGGCGVSSLTSGIGGSLFGGASKSTQVQSVTEEQLLSAAKSDVTGSAAPLVAGVSHGCPKVEAKGRDNHITIYEKGRVGDGLAIMHRGEITKTARECVVEPGRVTVKYGFSGRVLMGPRGGPGTITLPVAVMVADSQRQPVANDQMIVSVEMVADNPIGYFSAVRTLTFDVAEGARPGEYEMLVSFERTAPGAG